MRRRLRFTICAGLVAGILVRAAAAETAGPPHAGAILLGIPHHYNNDWAIVDLRNGAERLLPRSRTTTRQSGWDIWSATAPGAHELVRVSSRGDIDFFDRNTLSHTGGFSLASLAGTRNPEIFGEARVSPNGQYLIAYWKPDSRQREPEIVIFDRQGRVVQHGSPFQYDALLNRAAIDWLPDSRHYVYLANDKIVIGETDSGKLLHVPLHLPSGVGTAKAKIAVSPDGRQLALALAQDLRNGNGNMTGYNLLFVSALNGSGIRAMTRPSARVLSHGISMGHTSPSWSPDGRWLIFAPRQASAFGAPGFQDACPTVMVLPVDGNLHAVDGIDDAPETVLHANNAQVRSCESVQWLAP